MKYLFLFPIALFFFQCAPQDPRKPAPQAIHSLDSLNSILLRQLETHRVVMLADAQPGHIESSSRVIHFLGSWLDRIQTSSADSLIPRSLLLVLELGQPGVMAVNNYVRGGDRYTLIRFLVDEQGQYGLDTYMTRSLSADYLQFCEELRAVYGRVDSLNSKNPSSPISLDVAGFEPDPPYTRLDVRTKDRQEILSIKAQWDKAQRDAKSAQQLSRYLEEHPQAKALCFTHPMHLYRDAGDGIFAARILDSTMGRALVSVFEVRSTYGSSMSAPHIEEFKHQGESADFRIRSNSLSYRPMPFYLVKTQNTLSALSDLAEQYNASSDTLDMKLSRSLVAHALALLRRSHLALEPNISREIAFLQSAVAVGTQRALLAPQTFREIRGLISRFDAVKDVYLIDSVMTTFVPSQEFYDGLTTLIDKLPGNSVPVDDTRAVSITQFAAPEEITARWARSWKEKKSEIRTSMLLQILWLGTPGEVASAMNALRRETGQDFATPSQWGNWWDAKR